MDEHRAWTSQALSDLDASMRVLDPSNVSTYCQSIAKSQQAVEKAIKGLVVALRQHGIAKGAVARRHEVEPSISSLIRLPIHGERKDVCAKIRRAFNESIRDGVRALDRLVPRWPPIGALHARNTEYPYQIEPGASWRSPSEVGSFSLDEVNQFYKLARQITSQTSNLISAMDRD